MPFDSRDNEILLASVLGVPSPEPQAGSGVLSTLGRDILNLPSNVGSSFLSLGTSAGALLAGMNPQDVEMPRIPGLVNEPQPQGALAKFTHILGAGVAPNLVPLAIPYAGAANLARAAGSGEFLATLAGNVAAGGIGGLPEGGEGVARGAALGAALSGVTPLSRWQRLPASAAIAAASAGLTYGQTGNVEDAATQAAVDLLMGQIPAQHSKIATLQNRNRPLGSIPSDVNVHPDFYYSQEPSYDVFSSLNRTQFGPQLEDFAHTDWAKEGLAWELYQQEQSQSLPQIDFDLEKANIPYSAQQSAQVIMEGGVVQPRDYPSTELPNPYGGAIFEAYNQPLSKLGEAYKNNEGLLQQLTPNVLEQAKGKVPELPEYQRIEGGITAPIFDSPYRGLIQAGIGAGLGYAAPAENDDERLLHAAIGLGFGNIGRRMRRGLGAVEAAPKRGLFSTALTDLEVDPKGRVMAYGKKLLGKSPQIPIGKLSEGGISKSEIEAFKLHYPEAFNQDQSEINVATLQKAMSERPMLDVRTYGVADEITSKFDQERAAIEHDLDTQFPQWRAMNRGENVDRSIVDNPDFARLQNRLRDINYEDNLHNVTKQPESATARFSQVNPYSPEILRGEQEISPGHKIEWAGDISVNVPLSEEAKKYTGSSYAGYETPASRETRFQSSHYPGEAGRNQLAFVRGAMHVYEPGSKLPNGRTARQQTKVFEIWENQSDWKATVADSQADYTRRHEKASTPIFKRGKKWILTTTTGHELAYEDKGVAEFAYKKQLEQIPKVSNDHPLLDQAEQIGYKAAVAKAREMGADYVALSDSESAMITEQHDKITKTLYKLKVDGVSDQKLEKSFGRAYKRESGKNEATVLIDSTGDQAKFIEKSGAKIVSKEVQPPEQSSGMTAAYNKRGPDILRKITGVEPTKADFGVHQNVEPISNKSPFTIELSDLAEPGPRTYTVTDTRTGQQRKFATGEEADDYIHSKSVGSPVFKNKDGTPKANNTARLFDLRKRKALERGVPTDIESFQPISPTDDAFAILQRGLAPYMQKGEKIQKLAAIRNTLDGEITTGFNHANAYENALGDKFFDDEGSTRGYEEGFITNQGRFFDRVEAGKLLEKTRIVSPLHSEDVRGETGMKLKKGDIEGFISTHLAASIAGAGIGGLIGYKKSHGNPSGAIAGAVYGGLAGFFGFKVIEAISLRNGSLKFDTPKATFLSSVAETKKAIKLVAGEPLKDLAGQAVYGNGGNVAAFLRGFEFQTRLHMPEFLRDAITTATGAANHLIELAKVSLESIRSFQPSDTAKALVGKYIEGQILPEGDVISKIANSGGVTLAQYRKSPKAVREAKDFTTWIIGEGKNRKIYKLSKDTKEQLLQAGEKALRDQLPQADAKYGEFAITSRRSIDGLIDMFSEGLPEGTLKNTVQGSIGQYLSRAYRIFNDPKFKVNPAILQKVMVERGAYIDGRLLEKAVNQSNGYKATDYNALITRLRGSASKDAAARLDRIKDFEKVTHGGEDYYVRPDVKKLFENQSSDPSLRKALDIQLHEYHSNEELYGIRGSSRQILDTSTLKRRQDLSKNYRELIGEYTDPLERLAVTLQRLHNSARSARFISEGVLNREIDGFKAAMPKDVWDAQVKNLQAAMAHEADPAKLAILQKRFNTIYSYMEAPNDLTVGILKGQMVSRFVHDQLKEYSGPFGVFDTAIGRGMVETNRISKLSHTGLNPLSYIRQWWQIPMFAAIGRASWSSSKQAFNAIKNKDATYFRLIKAGVIGADYVRGELRYNAEQIFNGHYDSEIVKLGKRFMNNAFELYRMPDNIVRAGVFLEAESRYAAKMKLPFDHSDVQAAALKWTDRRTMNYANVAPIIHTGRNIPFFNLYMTYTAEIARITKNVVIDAAHGEIHAMGLLGAFAAIPEIIQAASEANLSPDDRKKWDRAKKLSPDYSRNRFKMVMYKDSAGNFHYVDFTPWVVQDNWQEMMRGIIKGDIRSAIANNPVVSMQNSPFFTVMAELTTGKDIRNDRSFRGAGDALSAIAKELAPPLTPGIGYEWEKSLPEALGGKLGVTNLKTGRTPDIDGVLARYGLGIDSTSTNVAILQKNAQARMKGDIKNERAYLNDVLKSTASPQAKQRAMERFHDAVKYIIADYAEKLR